MSVSVRVHQSGFPRSSSGLLLSFRTSSDILAPLISKQAWVLVAASVLGGDLEVSARSALSIFHLLILYAVKNQALST